MNAATPQVLAGIRVLDVGRYIAGPFCAALLGDLGAEVIRVERVDGGEDRFVSPVTPNGDGALYMQVNRNKRSLALDLSTPEGLAVLRRQVALSDVVVANMPPQTLRKLGLDYDSLTAIRPDVILVTVSAFGGGGPLSGKLGFDGVAQVMSGAVHLSGPPGQPAKLMASYVDFGTALACAFGTVAALYHRRETGQGQLVEGSLLGTALTVANNALIEQALLEIDRTSTGNRSATGAPSDIFAVQDGWVIVQVMGNPMFRRWTRLLGRDDLLNVPEYCSDQSRADHGAALSGIMAEWCVQRTTAAALGALEEAKIPCGPVYSPRQVLEDAHVVASGAFTPIHYPGLERAAPVAQPPVTLSRAGLTIRSRAPLLGEHTRTILAESGYSEADIDEMLARGTVTVCNAG